MIRKTLDYQSHTKDWSVLRVCLVLLGTAIVGSILLLGGLYIFLHWGSARHQRSFEAQTSQRRLSGMTPAQVTKVLGSPEGNSRGGHFSAANEFFYMYKSEDGEYAVIHFKNGTVAKVSYHWQ